MKNEGTDLELLGMHLLIVARLYRREIDAAISQLGLSEASAQPIRYLARLGDPTRLGILAEVMNLEGPTLIRIVEQLVQSGLVERVDDEADKRAKLLRLTEKGQSLNKEVREAVSDFRNRVFADIPTEDVAAMFRVLEKLRSRLS
ncbi:MarR family winged helix-turn-helix transcriptional regulator (plasmid) [Agrobacterium radiobacter]|uniref:MarR family transcriptional regulator n=1 Tax=Agrobacterium tumefaciens str. B6 TaxID=1183423 RepID=A0A822VC55_AGRTU